MTSRIFKMEEAQPVWLKVPAVEPTLRVGIVLEEDRKKEIKFTLGEAGVLKSKDTSVQLAAQTEYFLKLSQGKIILASLDNDEIKIFDSSVSLDVDDKIAPQAGVKIEDIVAGRGFHWQKELAQTFIGKLEFISCGEYFIVVNVIGIEFYTVCAVASEMSGKDSPVASGMAQAACARSWAYVFLGSKYSDKPYQICNDDMSQRYQGTTHLSQAAIDLVLACRGEYIVLDNGDVFPAYYSKSCGGHVESMSELFGVAAADTGTFLDAADQDVWQADLSREDNFRKWLTEPAEKYFCGMIPEREVCKYLGAVDEGGDYFRWQHETAASTVIKKLKEKCHIDAAALTDLKIIKRGASGRILEMELTYKDFESKLQSIILGDQFYVRACLHESFLYSSAFVYDTERDSEGCITSINFSGAGWGHGGGYCQIGAVAMALKGYTYGEIVRHYYPQTHLVKAY